MQITNEDNMRLMSRYQDNYFDLAIVDPPYGIDRDKWDKKPTKKYWKELFRVSKNQIVFGGNYFNLPLTESWLCWDKTNNGKSFFKHKAKFELIWLSVKTKPDFIRYTLDGNVEGWSKPKPNYKKQKAIHSCQKPYQVYEFLLMNYAKEEDKILDTHLGSGSIAIACHNLGFDLTACELDKEYYEAAMQRVNNHKAQIRLF
jgi:site-specific DNA-methyltransferase (adenine-specific)